MTSSPRLALLWSIAERHFSLLVGIGTTLVLARLLTPAQVGVYSMCAAFTMMATLLRDFGVSEYLIQEPRLDRARLRSAFGLGLLSAWTMAAVVFGLRQPLARYFNEPGVAAVLAVTALQFVLLPLSSPTYALLNREMAFRTLFYLQGACTLAHAITALLLAWSGYGALSLAWAPIASVLVQTLVLARLRPHDLFMLPGWGEWRSVLHFGWRYMAARSVDNLSQNLHEPVIAKLFGFASLGLYSRAAGLVELFRGAVADAIHRVATPAFAAEHRAGRPVAEGLLRATAIYSAMSWPFFFFIALTAAEIIGVLFGPQWLPAAPVASVLALGALPAGLSEFVPQMLSATGQVQRRLQLSLWASGVHGVALLLVVLLLAGPFGLLAMAGASAISSLGLLALSSWHLHRHLGLGWFALLNAGRHSLLVTLASVAAQVAALTGGRALGLVPFALLPITALAGVLAWSLVARGSAHPAWGEIGRLTQVLRARR